jgi:hypothetical protein
MELSRDLQGWFSCACRLLFLKHKTHSVLVLWTPAASCWLIWWRSLRSFPRPQGANLLYLLEACIYYTKSFGQIYMYPNLSIPIWMGRNWKRLEDRMNFRKYWMWDTRTVRGIEKVKHQTELHFSEVGSNFSVRGIVNLLDSHLLMRELQKELHKLSAIEDFFSYSQLVLHLLTYHIFGSWWWASLCDCTIDKKSLVKATHRSLRR